MESIQRARQARQARRFARDQELDTACTLTQRVRPMIRHRVVTALDSWLMDGLACGMAAWVHFASDLPREPSAVQAALTLPYSHGQVEGEITTLTRLKWQSYERAMLDLLRQRMLYTA